MSAISVGSIVRCRNREWIVLPSSNDEIYLLRPLAGTDQEVCGIHRRLAEAGLDRIEPASFPPPDANHVGDAVGVRLLFDAARLTLRDGAGPFRSLGRISIRPRPYQFVPLLMALRLQPVRMLIADDVGIGKTVEALLIARELLARGEIQRICVLCPPYLCDQWQRELWQAFRLEAVVIRSGTISRLERDLPPGDHSIFGYYPHIVVSIDYAKSDRHRPNFLQHCPEFVIVDEAHGAAAHPSRQEQQQRHELLKALVRDPDRHLLLLTATPHSGIEQAFLSLLGLLREDFARLDLEKLKDPDRAALARHLIQRRRADVTRWLGEATPFPQRESIEHTYALSPQYRALFEGVYRFSRELVRSGEAFTGWRRRIRYWSALALLRCVMSSPAAAVAAIGKRLRGEGIEEEQDDSTYSPYVYESTEQDTIDAQPAHILEEGEQELGDSERRRLRDFQRRADEILGTEQDAKLIECAKLVRQLLQEGFHPIVWCRYIATSDYVAEQLQTRLERDFPGLRVISVTGANSEDEREAKVSELASGRHRYRVLVATDCLSEGINLQEHFNAVLHYDLPWNPNRLEQREGRVDRFGQRAPKVKAVLLYGRDNPVDGAVLEVLLRKAREIYNTLGIRVPVPVDSETIMEAVLHRLFAMPETRQLPLFEIPEVADVHGRWTRAAEEEKASRSRFAQHAIKPEEVERELKETDAVLLDPTASRRFLEDAAQRLNLTIRKLPDETLELSGLDHLPEFVRAATPQNGAWRVCFKYPAPDGADSLDRNHPFVQSMAQWLSEQALVYPANAPARRCGVIRTSAVSRRTHLLLCRLRYTLKTPTGPEMLAEEVRCFGFTGPPGSQPAWIEEQEALRLLDKARPEANVLETERKECVRELLDAWPAVRIALDPLIQQRARRLEEAHRRVRAAVQLARRGLAVARHFPPDLLGVLVLLPIPLGVRR